MDVNEWAVVIVKLEGSGRMRLHTYLLLLFRSCMQELMKSTEIRRRYRQYLVDFSIGHLLSASSKY